MNADNYTELAQQTSSPVTPALVTRLCGQTVKTDLSKQLMSFVKAGSELDILKRHIFYGKDLGKPLGEPVFNGKALTEGQVKIMHGIIGLLTEAGELASALLAWYYETDGKLDLVNLGEELGDNQWYVAEVLSGAGIRLSEVMQANIAKLRIRYPNKFTEYDAENRDIERERTSLGDSFAPSTPNPDDERGQDKCNFCGGSHKTESCPHDRGGDDQAVS